MKKVLSISLLFVFVIALSSTICLADFSYTIKSPNSANAQKYIISKSNIDVSVSADGYTFWHPVSGAETKAASSPGVLVYHFPLSKPITEATLAMTTAVFHWSYSQGHSLIYLSTDGVNWIKAVEATPPEHGKYKPGNISGPLPSVFTGKKDIYVKIELYSYGPRAADGYPWTNTAQHLRYSSSSDNVTLQLEVKDNASPVIYTTGSASFNPLTSQLYLPCVGMDGNYLWARFQVYWEPFALQLLNAGWTQGDASCASVDLANLRIDVPRFFVGQQSYQMSLQFQPPASFTITGFQNTGGYGDSGRCYAGCNQPNSSYESIRCAVSCDSLFGGDHALITGGFPHLRLGPATWDQCAQLMRDMGQPGW
jgi:hypothetical protein